MFRGVSPCSMTCSWILIGIIISLKPSFWEPAKISCTQWNATFILQNGREANFKKMERRKLVFETLVWWHVVSGYNNVGICSCTTQVCWNVGICSCTTQVCCEIFSCFAAPRTWGTKCRSVYVFVCLATLLTWFWPTTGTRATSKSSVHETR